MMELRLGIAMGGRRKRCPRCGTVMRKAGKIKAGLKRGLRDVYICPRCKYRSLK